MSQTKAKGSMTRIGKGVAAAAAAASLFLTLVSCSTAETDGGDGGLDPDAIAGEVDRGATLRAVATVPPGNLDPHTTPSENASFSYTSLVYDRLTQMIQGPNGPELAPMVATEWAFDEAGTTLTLTLRDDVVFSDGTAVDAAAVKASLERALTVEGSTARAPLSMIESVEAPDAATVSIVTSRPAADLPYLLSNGFGSIVNPTAFDKPDLDVAPEGSGAYVAREVVLGDRVVFERRDDYWDADAGLAQRIEISGVPDPNARVNAIQGGQADLVLIQSISYQRASTLGSGFEVIEYPGAGNISSMRLNPANPALADVRVRQALSLAIDREAVNAAIQSGIGALTSQPLSPLFEGQGYLPQPLVPVEHDPERARQLLEQAGYADGFVLRAQVANFSPMNEIGLAVQDQLSDIGVTMEISAVEAPVANSQWVEGTEFDALLNVRLNYETPALVMQRNYLSPTGWLGETPEEFSSSIVDAFNPNLTDAERAELIETASAIANEQVFDVWLFTGPSPILVTDRVVGGDSMGRAGYIGIFDLRYVGLAADD